MTHRYTAAADGWITFVTPARQLCVGGELDGPAVERLWGVLAGDGGAPAVLEVLASGGLFSTPPFVFVEAGGADSQVLVRGDATVAAGAEVVSGVGATTWIERRVAAGGLTITLAGSGSGSGSGSDSFPIVSGVVRASIVAIGDVADAIPVAPPAPVVAPVLAAPVAAPAAAPVVPVTTPPALADDVEDATVIVSPEERAAMSQAPVAAPVERRESRLDDTIRADSDDDSPENGEDEGGDHDGATVMMTTRRGRLRPPPPPPPPAPSSPRPVIVLPDGSHESLEDAIVVGRSPSVAGVPAGQLPRLVTVTSIDQDISRSHVRIALEGGTVVVTDLHSRNGTVVTGADGATHKLRAGEPTPVIAGASIDLGGVILRVEEH